MAQTQKAPPQKKKAPTPQLAEGVYHVTEPIREFSLEAGDVLDVNPAPGYTLLLRRVGPAVRNALAGHTDALSAIPKAPHAPSVFGPPVLPRPALASVEVAEPEGEEDPYVARIGWAAARAYRLFRDNEEEVSGPEGAKTALRLFSELVDLLWESEGLTKAGGAREEWLYPGLVIVLALERAAEDPDANVLGNVSTRWRAVRDNALECSEALMAWAEERVGGLR